MNREEYKSEGSRILDPQNDLGAVTGEATSDQSDGHWAFMDTHFVTPIIPIKRINNAHFYIEFHQLVL